MYIKSLNNLDSAVEKEIREVYSCCKKHDSLKAKLLLDGAVNFNQEINYLFLLYEENRLISFLYMFIPTARGAEISAYTLPEYRRKGCFKRLLLEAVEELKRYDVKDMLFVCESQCLSGQESIKRLGGSYDFTEYFMRFDIFANVFDKSYEYKTKLYMPGISDIEKLCHVSMLAFDESRKEAESFIINCFNSKNRKAYATFWEDRMIGIGNGYLGDKEAIIYGLGVLPEFQGRGFGKELLLLIMRDLLKNGYENITLEVDSNNLRAFDLYKRNGFGVEVAFDYYKKGVSLG
ncbi:GNAT family N-acetyltransferase [Lutispora saccharofermentans]|uniref:GNAT family N-acetyltransferase n=1 Tax=Lutispora saccharofermentans TaxID=3024236 RepID=A0ABT1NJT0_9FIRM|nr:GNAT family N-acetyltransferase [Lutispora saccharofermentans]MCQ1531339.1 GNAT family N-acetyltransferase [Lutispora saccharofermentans]